MAPRRRHPPALATAACALGCSTGALAEGGFPDIGLDAGASAAHHGSVSLAVQSLHTSGLILDSGINNNGAVTDTRSVRLGLSYMLDDHWELHAAVPYIRKRSLNDPRSHDPLKLVPPHPESEFLDDGAYHASMQDLQLGISRHFQLGDYHVEPYATLIWPTRDYTFFANAAVGQRLRRLRLGVEVEHQFTGSNLYYSAGYGYELVERIMGVHLNKHHLHGSGGYMFSPAWSAEIFVQARRGQGRGTDFFTSHRIAGDEYWYQHDRLSRHDYAVAGLGATWRINDRYSLTGTAGKMVWGRAVHDLERAYEVELSRDF
jgi:hypothetical protein